MASKAKATAKCIGAVKTKVSAAEFRKHVRKYLKAASTGHDVIIQERGRSAYVLRRLETKERPSIFGCMREFTQCEAGVVWNATEEWGASELPSHLPVLELA
jgi:prevent-host-death family protein